MEVAVKPNSGESSVVFDSEKKVYVAYLKSKAENGKANAELVKLLSKYTGKKVKIVSGKTSKKKIVKIID